MIADSPNVAENNVVRRALLPVSQQVTAKSARPTKLSRAFTLLRLRNATAINSYTVIDWFGRVSAFFAPMRLKEESTAEERRAQRFAESNHAGRQLRQVIVVLFLTLRCFTLPPWLLAADDKPLSKRDENLKCISEMTPIERLRLEESYRAFQKLPPDEQSRLRRLQVEIERDPELKAVFKEYEAWANTLSPGQRFELRRTADPRERMNLVEDFRNEPERGRPGERPPPDPRSNDPRPPNGGPPLAVRGDRMRLMEKLLGRDFPFGDRLGSSVLEMTAITQVLEQQLSEKSRTEIDKLDKADFFSRKVRVVRLTLEQHPLGPPHVRIFGGPESSTFDKVMSALSEDSPIKQLLKTRPNPDAQRVALLMALVRGLGNEMQRTIEDHLPNSDAIMRYSETLPPQERQRLNEYNREERFLELQQRYLKEQVPGIRELQDILKAPAMDKFLNETIKRMPNFNPRGAKGQFGPPDGAGRPSNNLRPEG